MQLRTFTAGGLILTFEDRPEQLNLMVGTSLPEDDRPDAIEGVVGLPPTIQEQLVEFVSRTWIAATGLVVLLVAWIFWRSWRQSLGLGTGPQTSPADRARAAVNELASELPKTKLKRLLSSPNFPMSFERILRKRCNPQPLVPQLRNISRMPCVPCRWRLEDPLSNSFVHPIEPNLLGRPCRRMPVAFLSKQARSLTSLSPRLISRVPHETRTL